MPLYPQGGGLYPNSIDNVLLMDMADSTVKGRAKGAGAGDPQDLTAQQLSLLLGGPNFRNILGRNGGFEVWQRGAGGSALFNFAASSAGYTADGWFLSLGSGQASQIAQVAGLTNGSRYAARFVRSAGQTGVAIISLEFALDTDEVALLRGNIVTLSMMMQAGPTWSPAGGILSVTFQTGTGANAARISSGLTSPVNIIPSTPQAITTTPTRYSFMSSVVVPANATQGCVLVQWTPVGTAGPNDMFDIDDVQLEVGSVATPFERRFFESELLACKRHFHKSFQYATAPAANVDGASAVSSPQTVGALLGNYPASIPFPVAMRATPAIAFFNPGAAGAQARNYSLSVDCSATATWTIGMDRFTYSVTTPAGSSAGQPILVHYTADAGI
jgi:hypothetical protein